MRPDLKICTTCSNFHMEPGKGPRKGDFLMSCSCRDKERSDAFEAKRAAHLRWHGTNGGYLTPDPIKLAEFVQKSERDYRVKFDPDFYVPSDCPYATEQLMIQDGKGLCPP